MILDKIFKNEKGEFIDFASLIFGDKNTENYIYVLAEAKAIKLISDMISKTEILTYELNNGKIEDRKGETYWRLNLQPNYNESGTQFRKKLVTKLLIDKEVLIIMNKLKDDADLLYVADTFNQTEEILKPKVYKNITLKDKAGNVLSVKKEYSKENAIYLSVKDELVENAGNHFKKYSLNLLNVIKNKFIRSNVAKWRLTRPRTRTSNTRC